MVRWKIDDSPELPLAVIEDTEGGDGVCEISGDTLRNEASEAHWAIAWEIVESHNAKLERG